MTKKHQHLRILLSAGTLATGLTMTGSVVAEEVRNPATALELPDLDVIGTTPLPGTGLPIEKYAGNVQIITADEIDEQNALELSEALYRNLGSVDINSSQNNPFQNDVHYRGFLASPLLGSAIGISAFVDGVRVNEGFGDTVNWDLLPEFAISNVTLIPGSNPLFGLNTLGGSLSLQTKNGFNFEGTGLDLLVGSHGRTSATVEHGGNSGNFDWYIGANGFGEDGWRQRSPSDVAQVFSKVGWENDKTDLDLSYTYVDNDLIGNGFVPASHLEYDREAVYTFPDQTQNTMHFVNLRGSHWLSDSLLAAGNVFYRNFERSTLNGDAELECGSEEEEGEEEEGEEEGGIHPANCEDEGGELEVEGEERNTFTETDYFGGALQFSHDAKIGGRDNQLVFGASYDKSETSFQVSEAEAELFQEGIAYGTTDAEEQAIDVDIDTEKENWALYATDTLSVTERLALTVSGRYQHSTVKIQDRTGLEENQDLNGDHSFSRFNPAAGLSFNASDSLTVYAAYNESFRVPTAAELTCADPEDPCNLPNSFVADPPLDPVIGKTFEVGARGSFNVAGSLGWSLGVFRTNLEDDLLFTTISSAGQGFFQNVDETRRQGIELGLNGLHDRLAWYMNYSLIDATFESAERLASVVDPEGLYVSAGDEIPAIPRHNVKLGVDVAATDKFSVGANMTYASSSFMRGDESNDLDKVSGYTVFNMSARFQANDNVQLWLKVDNLFDKEYVTSGIRNFNGFPADGGEIEEEQFVSPGAPRSAWVGLKLRF